MESEVYFQLDADGKYSLIVNDEVFKTPFTNEDEIAMLTESVDNILYLADEDCSIVIQLSGEEPPIGLILDEYVDADDEPINSSILLFDDFLIN